MRATAEPKKETARLRCRVFDLLELEGIDPRPLPLVERAGLVAAFDDAWLLIGGLVACSLLLLLVRTPSRSGTSS